jgi:uncharacterized protein YbbC (DUF1343 family)/CubicO group peptidase (beta-lactamase class C family)
LDALESSEQLCRGRTGKNRTSWSQIRFPSSKSTKKRIEIKAKVISKFKWGKTLKQFARTFLILVVCLLVEQPALTTLLAQDKLDSPQYLKEEHFASIEEITKEVIRAGKIPGAVILIGNQEKILYRQAFGFRALVPRKRLMTIDTIFDIASLTKVVATTTAVMQLVEKGKVDLEDPVSNYWPEFKTNGKEGIKVKDLLTHYSGLRPGLNLNPKWSGYDAAIHRIIAEKPVDSPGTLFIYSDINFQILGELVHRISGQPLDKYCSEHIFKPLGMKDTRFNPSSSLRKRIAPTQYQHKNKGKMLWGEVHDPISYEMGGVSGHAGLFSTADDLSIFAQMLLREGSIKGANILSPLTIEKMTTPQTPPNKTGLRGLGWEIDPSFAPNQNGLSQMGFYGHTGFTGTSIWIDPVSKTYVIILTNQVHPDGRGDVKPLRTQITTVISNALRPIPVERALFNQPSLTTWNGLMKNNQMQGAQNNSVQTGIDVLKREKFASLKGLRIGLITNHSGTDSTGQRTLDLMVKAPGLKLIALFSPEHGLSGELEENVPSSKEITTGLPVYSLYGKVRGPTNKMLKGLDALVFDIQDAGVRFYTYLTTMGYTMEAAAKKKIPFYVLDRPNPLTASMVQGPIMDRDLKSFTGYFPLPVRHGMTLGELAVMFNAEKKIGVKLHIIKMRGYNRTDWYDETGLQWVKPSPNLRTLTEAILYPGVALVEGSNVSVGRGTDMPFELFGAPWINGDELALYLNNRQIQGVRFMSVDFKPASSRFKDEICHGVQILIDDRQTLDPPALGIEIASALQRLYPNDFQLDKTLWLIGSRDVLKAIKDGQDPHLIVQGLQESLEKFSKLRSKYLLY